MPHTDPRAVFPIRVALAQRNPGVANRMSGTTADPQQYAGASSNRAIWTRCAQQATISLAAPQNEA